MNVYVYTLSDPRTPENIRYIGITSNEDITSRYGKNFNVVDQRHSSRWIRKIKSEGVLPLQLLLDTVHSEEWDFLGMPLHLAIPFLGFQTYKYDRWR